jgi:hypothetical protein
MTTGFMSGGVASVAGEKESLGDAGTRWNVPNLDTSKRGGDTRSGSSPA